jgi:hypothetical protein
MAEGLRFCPVNRRRKPSPHWCMSWATNSSCTPAAARRRPRRYGRRSLIFWLLGAVTPMVGRLPWDWWKTPQGCQQDRILRSFPEVASVFGAVGRSNSATDNAPDTPVMLRPREQWPSGMTYEKLFSKWTKSSSFRGSRIRGRCPSKAVGDWTGLLAGQLHIIVHITKSADGHYSGSLESPDQGAFVLPAENVEATPTHLAFSIPKLPPSPSPSSWPAPPCAPTD